MSLTTYKKKRNFKSTNEPAGKKSTNAAFRFVVQKHAARTLHYDLRLELGGVLKSWAVPKGPSMNSADKRLAVQTEDHPVEYLHFKGVIPKGNYGAGKMEIWDTGKFIPVDKNHDPITEKAALANLKKGELKFAVKGKKLCGEFVLVRMKDEKNWLLIKHKEEAAAAIPSIRYGKGEKVRKAIAPMLAGVSKQAFDDPEWIYEIKWDGYRAIAEITDDNVLFYSRNGIDLSQRFPSIYEQLKKIKHVCIIDGEIVLFNEHNQPDFQKLQHYENHQEYPLAFYVFDMLELDGKNMEDLPLIDRKKLLKKMLGRNRHIKYCDHVEEKGVEFFALAQQQGLEGIIAKNKQSTYSRGYRSKQWLKIKTVQQADVTIMGYTAPKGGRSHFGALVLGVKKGRSWEYKGHVGTGFNQQLLASLKEELDARKAPESPFKEKVPLNDKVTWVKPELKAVIGYTEVTRDGIFRHPVFMGVKEKTPKRSSTKKLTTASSELNLTNQDKIYFPKDKITKGQLIAYYTAVAPYILPHLKGRPMSLKRNPNGIKDKGFYHKDAGENAPSFVDVFPVESGDSGKIIDYIVCNNKNTLLYLANLGCIEMNPWNSQTDEPDNPTWLSIDIDPSPKNTFTQVVETAKAVKQVCDRAGLRAFCKTSGASGLHVYLPLKNRYNYETVRDFAHLLAQLVNELVPETTTLERSLKKRGNRIYLDYLQNRPGQTLASVYSVRPVDGAQVSAALDWKELTASLDPSKFTIKNMLARLKKKGDLFKGVLTTGNDLQKALKRLKK